jgi:serine/threonine-protein kinase
MTADGQNKSNTALIIILVILGAIAVFAIGILLGNILGGSEPTPPSVTLPTPAPGIPSAVAIDYVNVRSGPSVQYPIYGIAQPGSAAEVIGKSEDGGWWVVKLPPDLVGAGQGWVSAEYTQATNTENVPVIQTPPLEEIIIPTPNPGAPSAEALDAINVRSGPGTNYPSYGIAPKGMKFEVIGKSEDDGWWVVKIPVQYVESGQGWVSDDYVKTENSGSVPVVPAP